MRSRSKRLLVIELACLVAVAAAMFAPWVTVTGGAVTDVHSGSEQEGSLLVLLGLAAAVALSHRLAILSFVLGVLVVGWIASGMYTLPGMLLEGRGGQAELDWGAYVALLAATGFAVSAATRLSRRGVTRRA